MAAPAGPPPRHRRRAIAPGGYAAIARLSFASKLTAFLPLCLDTDRTAQGDDAWSKAVGIQFTLDFRVERVDGGSPPVVGLLAPEPALSAPPALSTSTPSPSPPAGGPPSKAPRSRMGGDAANERDAVSTPRRLRRGALSLDRVALCKAWGIRAGLDFRIEPEHDVTHVTQQRSPIAHDGDATQPPIAPSLSSSPSAVAPSRPLGAAPASAEDDDASALAVARDSAPTVGRAREPSGASSDAVDGAIGDEHVPLGDSASPPPPARRRVKDDEDEDEDDENSCGRMAQAINPQAADETGVATAAPPRSARAPPPPTPKQRHMMRRSFEGTEASHASAGQGEEVTLEHVLGDGW